MGTLRRWKHEKFAQEIAAGTQGQQAYVLAGYMPNRANHNKLLNRPEVAARITELREDRANKARAARLSIEEMLSALDQGGIDRIADFFERNEAGILRVRDLQSIPVEVSIALLRALGEGFRIVTAV